MRPVAAAPKRGMARFASLQGSGYGSRPSTRAAGAFVSDIFREIDEELRRDNLLKLWKQYGRYVIAAVVLVLIAAGAVVAWRDHQASERRRSEEHTSELQSLAYLVCRLLLEKK